MLLLHLANFCLILLLLQVWQLQRLLVAAIAFVYVTDLFFSTCADIAGDIYDFLFNSIFYLD